MIDVIYVRVRAVCRRGRRDMFDYRPCTDEHCDQCGGHGQYDVDMDWNTFVEEIRDALRPSRDSQE